MGGCRADGGAQGAVEGGDRDFEVDDAGVGLEGVGCVVENGILSDSALHSAILSFSILFWFRYWS